MAGKGGGPAPAAARSTAWASSGPGSTSGSRPTRSGRMCSSSSRDSSGRRGWSTKASPPSTH